MTNPKYPIGTQFKTRGKYSKVCTVTDILTTFNSKGDIVKRFYQSEHIFNGQIVINYETPESTIALGLVQNKPDREYACIGRCYVTENSDMQCMQPTSNPNRLCNAKHRYPS